MPSLTSQTNKNSSLATPSVDADAGEAELSHTAGGNGDGHFALLGQARDTYVLLPSNSLSRKRLTTLSQVGQETRIATITGVE